MQKRTILCGLLLTMLLLQVPPASAQPPSTPLLAGDPATRAIYLLLEGEKRLLPDQVTLQAFGWTLDDVRWDRALLAAPPSGPNLLPFSGGDLVRDEQSGELYLLWRGRHAVEDAATLGAFGWSTGSARPVPAALLEILPLGEPLPRLFPGNLIGGKGADCVYILAAGRHWLPSTEIVVACGWRERPIQEIEPWLMGLIPEGEIVPSLHAGCLLKSSDEQDERVYILVEGKHLIPDEATFAAYGWRSSRIRVISPEILDVIGEGAALAHAEKSGNIFVYQYRGQCTWYVAERRIPPSSRHAISWLEDAEASGFATGQQPLPGAVIVYGVAHGVYGHVAYIDAVFPDGSFALVDSNICGWECVRTRLTSLGKEVGVLGFVLWRYE